MLQTRFHWYIALGLILCPHAVFSDSVAADDKAAPSSVSEPSTESALPEISLPDRKSATTVPSFPRVRKLAVPALNTDVLFGYRGKPLFVVPEKGVKAQVIMLGGTGALRTDKGIEVSMGPAMDKLIDLGAYPYAAENPLYYMAADSNADRTKTIEAYRSGDAQMNWFYQLLGALTKDTPESVPVILVGRSTGSALLLQAAHEYFRGVRRAAVMEKVRVAYAMGIVGHSHEHRKIWYGTEYFERTRLNKPKDIAVAESGPVMFDSFHYTDPGDVSELKAPTFRLVVALGSQDHFFPIDYQIEVINQIAAKNPNMKIEARLTPYGHDQAWRLVYRYKDGEAVKNVQVDAGIGFTEHLKYLVRGEKKYYQETPGGNNQVFVGRKNIIEVRDPGYEHMANLVKDCQQIAMDEAFRQEFSTHYQSLFASQK